MDQAPTSRGDTLSAPAAGQRLRQRVKLIALLALFASPVVASYLAYYVFPPAGRTNYGTLIEPQRPMPSLRLEDERGAPTSPSSLRGQWLLVQVDSGACDARCQAKLYALRQQRTMTGKHRDRIDRVWLVDDASAVVLPGEFEGTRVMRGSASELQAWLPTEPGRGVREHIYLVDPLGNLMMRFPADGDPAKIHKDLSRLLRASRVG